MPASNDSLMDFLLDLGYKGLLKHISEMFVDHMHQPWRTLGAIDEVFLVLGWNLEEIHVTWAHLEKKRTRLRTYTKSLEDLCI
ncbi:hypothetical protein Tco_0875220 [Tanacetum coccineum]|uniref:Uncharacterized protein n=1 Tax=Tanacetum coccineum TaxID=301880 RepID=A0ABQ5BTR0_9ASTR